MHHSIDTYSIVQCTLKKAAACSRNVSNDSEMIQCSDLGWRRMKYYHVPQKTPEIISSRINFSLLLSFIMCIQGARSHCGTVGMEPYALQIVENHIKSPHTLLCHLSMNQ